MNTETNTNTAAAVTPQGATVAPGKAPAKKAAIQKKNAPKAPKKATGAKSAKPVKAGKKPAPPRATSKGGMILEMIGRVKGATLAEIMAAAGWQAHSVRGFISIAPKKHNVKIESSKNDGGERVYRSIK